VGAGVVGAGVVGPGVVGAVVVGAGVVGTEVVDAGVVGAGVVGAAVLGAFVEGVAVDGATVLGPVVGGTVVSGSLAPPQNLKVWLAPFLWQKSPTSPLPWVPWQVLLVVQGLFCFSSQTILPQQCTFGFPLLGEQSSFSNSQLQPSLSPLLWTDMGNEST